MCAVMRSAHNPYIKLFCKVCSKWLSNTVHKLSIECINDIMDLLAVKYISIHFIYNFQTVYDNNSYCVYSEWRGREGPLTASIYDS